MSDKDELERKEFEDWAINQCAYDMAYSDATKRTYRSMKTKAAWKVWQASRTAIELEIDWPEANDDYWKDGEEGAYARGHEDGKDKTALAVRQALKSAGIKVNP